MRNESTRLPDPSTKKPVPLHENASKGHDDRTDNESADPKKHEEPKHAPAGDSHDDTRAKTMPAGDTDLDDKPKNMHDGASSKHL